MNRRKSVLSQSAERFYQRIERGELLPPSMRRGTREYVKSHYWSTMNQRCVNGKYIQDTERNNAYLRKGVEILLTKEEFCAWVDDNWACFDRIYSEGSTPSIDRKDPSKGYEPSNMQVIDLRENMRKDRVKPVIGTCLKTRTKKRYASGVDTEVDGFCRKGVSRAVATRGCHKGWFWEFDVE